MPPWVSAGRSALVLAAVGMFAAAPMDAQGPNWFYCYAPNAATGAVYVSDMHAVGPVSERARYGSEFASYLTSRGELPAGAQAYCVMRATEREIARGQQAVTELCSECGEAKRIEHVTWIRGGKSGRQFASAEVAKPPASVTGASVPPATRSPHAEKVEPGPAAEHTGAFLMGRTDATGVVYTANEENAQFLTRHKADLKGGKWTWILLNDPCPGWVAVAYATNGDKRHYFVARGSEFEGSARVAAIKMAEAYAASRGSAWLAGVLASFMNEYREPGPDFSGGAIQGVKQEVRKMVVNPCADARRTEYTAVGVRG